MKYIDNESPKYALQNYIAVYEIYSNITVYIKKLEEMAVYSCSKELSTLYNISEDYFLKEKEILFENILVNNQINIESRTNFLILFIKDISINSCKNTLPKNTVEEFISSLEEKNKEYQETDNYSHDAFIVEHCLDKVHEVLNNKQTSVPIKWHEKWISF